MHLPLSLCLLFSSAAFTEIYYKVVEAANKKRLLLKQTASFSPLPDQQGVDPTQHFLVLNNRAPTLLLSKSSVSGGREVSAQGATIMRGCHWRPKALTLSWGEGGRLGAILAPGLEKKKLTNSGSWPLWGPPLGTLFWRMLVCLLVMFF